MVNQRTCVLKLLDYVHCVFIGLTPAHTMYLYDKFYVYVPNYYFQPRYQLTEWDGKKHLFSKNGKTFINLLTKIVPDVRALGYNIQLIDQREHYIIQPKQIDQNFFSHIIDPDTDQPWMLRDYQIEMINILLNAGCGVGVAGTGSGKDQPLTSKILTPTGWTTMGSISPGDQVISATGNISYVVDVFPQGKQQVYQIEFQDGSEVQCGLYHLWKVRTQTQPLVNKWRVMTTKDIMDFLEFKRVHRTVDDISIPLIEPMDCPPGNFTISPYDYGRLIGLNQKTHIPLSYKQGSVEQRIELLSGLLDIKGSVDNRGFISFSTVNKRLMNDIQEVVWSIGGLCSITSFITRQSNYSFTCFIEYYRPYLLFSIKDKQDKCKQALIYKNHFGQLRRIKSVQHVGDELTQCIAIDDPSRLYVTDNYAVTHNTCMCAALAKSYEISGNYKSIIIVPDKNLSSQTSKDYAFFDLDVGQYGGGHKETNHHHLVSTWQSLKNNPTLLHDFQIVVVDECHGLSGNVISSLLNDHGQHIPIRFGVTGTLPKEPANKAAVKIAVGPVQHTIPAYSLINQGYLSNLHIDIIQHKLDLKVEYQEYLKETDDNPPMTYARFRASYHTDWADEKRYLQQRADRNDWLIEYLDAKRNQEKGNVLCLVDGIKFGKKLAKEIPGAIFLYGKDDVEVREQMYEKFKHENHLLLIASVKIASTGLNIKRIFNLMFIDVGKSFIRVIQTIGRGLRRGYDKDYVHVSDICSNLRFSQRHLHERMKYYNEAKYCFKKNQIILNSRDDFFN